jgi:hypothetical protein
MLIGQWACPAKSLLVRSMMESVAFFFLLACMLKGFFFLSAHAGRDLDRVHGLYSGTVVIVLG